MATGLLNPIKNQSTAYETIIAAGGGLKTLFFPVDPRFKTSIHVTANDEEVSIKGTTSTRLTTANAATIGAGQDIVDLELAHYFRLSSGTDEYISNDDTHLSCIRIEATPVTKDVIITIQQYKVP